jgi:hypothetical protein
MATGEQLTLIHISLTKIGRIRLTPFAPTLFFHLKVFFRHSTGLRSPAQQLPCSPQLLTGLRVGLNCEWFTLSPQAIRLGDRKADFADPLVHRLGASPIEAGVNRHCVAPEQSGLEIP